MNRLLEHTAFAVGLLAIGWVGAGYVPGNLLALALVLLIGAFYLMGALELHRFRQATSSLVSAVAAADQPPPSLAEWVAQLPLSLRHAVRQRVDGERAGLPGPALTPYLAGLLVLLGMLGTFLGMVVTLNGTGLALQTASDLDAIRASLAAPVRGLGLAFGTSVAGVAASAMLGLMSALARRDRQQAVQQLDARIATTLRAFSQAHQREESLLLLRAQAESLPALLVQLQGLVEQVTRQGQSLHDELLAGQARFRDDTGRAFTALADDVGHSLKANLADGVRQAGANIEPAVQAAMAGLAREATTLREALAAAAQRQLDGAAAQLERSTGSLLTGWQAALAEQRLHGEATARDLHAGLARFSSTFEDRSAALVDGIAARLDRSAESWSRAWVDAMNRQQQVHDAAMAQAREVSEALVTGFDAHAVALRQGMAEAQAARDVAAAAREHERVSTFHDALARMAASLHQQARDDGAALTDRQQQICTTLERTAMAITAQAETHARATLAEIAQLVQTASEAPRAAAQVIGELRQALSDSLVRDNVALDERNRLMATLGGLLDAVNHASTEQRAAIDALVATTTGVLDRAGTRFAEQVETGSRSLQAVAVHVAGGAAEVASLGEGFGVAVHQFSASTEQLMAQLQRIEAALAQTLARSDEQLAYYVAQAREIVDLTLGSQQQLVEGLQRATTRSASEDQPA